MKPCLLRHEIVGCLEIQPDLDLKYLCIFNCKNARFITLIQKSYLADILLMENSMWSFLWDLLRLAPICNCAIE